MKKCIKCRQEIPDDCEVCTYCGQWQEQIQEKSSIETTKQCIKCKQHIPINCEECTFCGQLQPINENEKDRGNTLNAENTEKENLKKQWKTAVVVIVVSVIVFIGIISMIMTPSTKKESSSTDYQTSTASIEPIDNSVDGKGYYYFDNKLNEATVEKFNNVFYGDTGGISLDISVDDFSYIGDVMLLDEKVSQYNYIDFNGKTGVFIYVNEDNQVSAFTFAYDTKMLNDPTTSAEYVNKQLVGRPASWIYALSDTLTYEKAYDIYETLYFDKFITEIVNANEEGHKPKVAFYYSGYAIIVTSSSSNAQDNITVFKADSNFIEKNNIGTGKQTIFQPIDEETTADSNLQENSQSSDVTYKHTAISGANIYREDGSPKFIYFEVCEKCGEQDSIERMVTAKYEGDYTDNFICENCGNNQEVVIKIERINDNVKADYETTQNGKTSDENRVSFGEYSFVLPDNWGYDESSEMLYENYNHSLGYSGMLLRIIKTQTHPDNDFYSCAYHLLGEKDGYYYVATEPNGMEFDYQDETATAKYNTAKEQIGQVLSSFEFE